MTTTHTHIARFGRHRFVRIFFRRRCLRKLSAGNWLRVYKRVRLHKSTFAYYVGVGCWLHADTSSRRQDDTQLNIRRPQKANKIYVSAAFAHVLASNRIQHTLAECVKKSKTETVSNQLRQIEAIAIEQTHTHTHTSSASECLTRARTSVCVLGRV